MNFAFQIASVCLLFLLVAECGASNNNNNQEDNNNNIGAVVSEEQSPYGTDISWPTQYAIEILGEPATGTIAYSQKEAYLAYMKGCFEAYSEKECRHNDAERIAMNLAQPAFQTNFTSAGYAKVRAPAAAFAKIQRFWRTQPAEQIVKEKWASSNTYTNHWEAPSEMMSIHSDPGIKRMITEQVQQVLETWSGQPLIPTSVYGIRIYHNQSILAPHVDRLPLVLSAIINVDEACDEPWPLEVIGHDGVAVNLTMEPGDMVLYESHSVIHGRPYPLKGRFMANLFLHFEPFSYTANLERKMQKQSPEPESAKDLFERTLTAQDTVTNKESPGDLPHYIEKGTQQAMQWLQDYVFYRTAPKKKRPHKRTSGVKDAHVLAASGLLEELKAVAADDPGSLHAADSNGWKPLHEAARSGRTNIIEYLVEEGAEVNDRTNEGKGGSPLWWAEHLLPPGMLRCVMLCYCMELTLIRRAPRRVFFIVSHPAIPLF
jgi:prolyl 4-hydroxylase